MAVLGRLAFLLVASTLADAASLAIEASEACSEEPQVPEADISLLQVGISYGEIETSLDKEDGLHKEGNLHKDGGGHQESNITARRQISRVGVARPLLKRRSPSSRVAPTSSSQVRSTFGPGYSTSPMPDLGGSSASASAASAAARAGAGAGSSAQTSASAAQAPGLLSAILGGLTSSDYDYDEGWCVEARVGFMTLLMDSDSGDLLAVDLTDAFKESTRVSFMVTAMNVRGTYTDEYGYLSNLAFPVEETASTVFEFALSANNQSVDVYKLQMGIRTSDHQTKVALDLNTGSGWMDTLPRVEPPACYSSAADDRIVVSAGNLLATGFYVMNSLAGQYYTSRVVRAAAYPKNVAISIEYLMADTRPLTPLTIGFSLMHLPKHQMPPRDADARLLYFTTDYTDMGYRTSDTASELPSDAVDREVSMIWRYDLERLKGSIRIHVDPALPRRWHHKVKEGIEAWNVAFAEAGFPGAVRAVLPGDSDWPADYDMADVRFNTISWILSTTPIAIGIAKVDPRSGEIVKGDVLFSSGWVSLWMDDLDHLQPDLSHTLETTEPGAAAPGAGAPGANVSGTEALRASMLHHHTERRASQGFGMFSAAAGRPLNAEQREELLGDGIKDVIMHEVGHILGLRHNFKGSIGITYDCVMDPKCTATNGITASVMDYSPMNLPTEEHPDVHVFTPVVGAYDKLAIRYGYAVDTGANLVEVVNAAEAYDSCYDDDTYYEDPLCAAYDMTSDPLRYYDERLKLIAQAMKYLVNMSVANGDAYTQYGNSARGVISQAFSIGATLVPWLGGIEHTYAHRNDSKPPNEARQPVSAEKQRKAIGLILRVLRSEKSGFLPPPEALPYLVAGDKDFIYSLDIEEGVRIMTANLINRLLSVDRIRQIHKQEHLLGTSGDGLTVADYFTELIDGIIGEGLEVALQDPREWDLHRQLVYSLRKLFEAKVEFEDQIAYLFGATTSSVTLPDRQLPEEVFTILIYHLRRIHTEVESAHEHLVDGGSFAGWRFCSMENATCSCHGLVRFGLEANWSVAYAATGDTPCSGDGEYAPELGRRCECLANTPDSTDALSTHVAVLRRELSQVFCEPGEEPCQQPRIRAYDPVPSTLPVRSGARSGDRGIVGLLVVFATVLVGRCAA